VGDGSSYVTLTLRPALRDPRLSLGGGVAAMFDRLSNTDQVPLGRHLSMWMGSLDPPDHPRIRSLMHKAFTPRLVESIHSFTQVVADELIDTVQAKRRMDVVRDLAYPLPAIVIATILGTLTEDRERFKK
jgi:pimeloyl-[acyl-carrier protein] synthase